MPPPAVAHDDGVHRLLAHLDVLGGVVGHVEGRFVELGGAPQRAGLQADGDVVEEGPRPRAAGGGGEQRPVPVRRQQPRTVPVRRRDQGVPDVPEAGDGGEPRVLARPVGGRRGLKRLGTGEDRAVEAGAHVVAAEGEVGDGVAVPLHVPGDRGVRRQRLGDHERDLAAAQHRRPAVVGAGGGARHRQGDETEAVDEEAGGLPVVRDVQLGVRDVTGRHGGSPMKEGERREH